MGKPAAKQGDRIVGTDTHVVAGQLASGLPFSGLLQSGLSSNVRIMSRPAATVGSGASNVPPHPGATSASNLGRVLYGSATVKINGKPAARSGDIAMTCNEPTDLPVGSVVASGTVNIGG